MEKSFTVEQLIGKRIRRVRKEKGFTQQRFAEAVGISVNYLSDVERGKSSVRLDKLVTIINVLGCTADDLFADVITGGYLTQASRLTERMEALSLEDRNRLSAVIEAYLDGSPR